MRHKPSRKPSSLVYSVFPNKKSFSFFLISVKMDLEIKVIGFQFEPEKSISNHKGFFQDSSDEVMLWSETSLTGKITTLAFGASVGTALQRKQKRNACAAKKWRGFAGGFGIFVLSQEIILSELQKQSRRGVLRNFAMNYLKFLRISFLTEHLRWLLLELTHNLMTLSPFAFVTRVGFRTPAIRSKLQKTHRKTPVLESLLI